MWKDKEQPDVSLMSLPRFLISIRDLVDLGFDLIDYLAVEISSSKSNC